MVTQINAKAGAFVPLHHHEAEQIILVSTGQMRGITGENSSQLLGPGGIWVVPANIAPPASNTSRIRTPLRSSAPFGSTTSSAIRSPTPFLISNRMSELFAYLNGRTLEEGQVRISPFDRGFLWGDGVYEITPCFKTAALSIGGPSGQVVPFAPLRPNRSRYGQKGDGKGDPGSFGREFSPSGRGGHLPGGTLGHPGGGLPGHGGPRRRARNGIHFFSAPSGSMLC